MVDVGGAGKRVKLEYETNHGEHSTTFIARGGWGC